MKVAVTGGIATGKSTVCSIFRELGFTVASSDEIAKNIRELPEVQSEVKHLLGVDPSDVIAIRAAISQFPEKRVSLNNIMHGRVLAAISDSTAQVIEVPLLFESAIPCLFPYIVCVSCDRAIQLDRLSDRVQDRNEAERLIELQLPLRVKELLSDVTIRTDLPLASVRTDVARIGNRIAM
ncbi:MAG: dephospho-CoA kinase [Fimbriimonadaceae bacterium]